MNYMRRIYLILLGATLAILLGAGSALAASGTVKVDDLKLREEASTKSDVLQTLNQGDKLEIISKTGSWYKVKFGKYTGFVYGSYIKVSGSVTDASALKYGDYSAEVKKLQERLKELGYFEGTCMYNFGEKTQAAVKAFQARNGLTQDGIAGTATLEKLYSSTAVKAESETITLKYGDYSAEVKKLQERLKELGYFTGTCMYNFGEKTQAAVKAFQARNGLTQDGVAGKATLDKLYSSSALPKEEEKTYVTERLDWFKDGESTFPKKAIIKIKDVKTGLIFEAKVLYGTNHLDVEPLTAADTQILLNINGGVDFSYRRRAVLVQYDEHVYAASIYSEPHGDQTILDNNFDGQFCLHFYGSKTHGTDRVDEDHKACEEQALKATW